MIQQDGMQWEGIINFIVFDEEEIRKRGLLENQQAFFVALQNGTLPVKRKQRTKNTVTNYARQSIAYVLTGGVVAPPSYMQLGTGIGTPAATDTNLWSPSSTTLKPCSIIQPYMSYYAQYMVTWLTGDNILGTWSEIGLKSADGNLWAHAAISSNLTVHSGEILTAQWLIQILSS